MKVFKNKNMQKLSVFIVLFFIAGLSAHAQSSFEYTYDAAGNRTVRKVIVLNPAKKGVQEQIQDVDERYSFNVFPNPTEGLVTIEAEEAFLANKHKQGLVYDLKGNVLFEFPVTEQVMPIDLSNTEAGMYIIKIQGDDYSKEWKIVKL